MSVKTELNIFIINPDERLVMDRAIPVDDGTNTFSPAKSQVKGINRPFKVLGTDKWQMSFSLGKGQN